MRSATTRLTGRPSLPKPGTSLEQVYLAFLAVAPAAEAQLVPLLREALAQAGQRGANAAALGLATENPWRTTIRAAMPAITYNTCIEAVAWQAEDFTSLATGRVAQPEIALL